MRLRWTTKYGHLSLNMFTINNSPPQRHSCIKWTFSLSHQSLPMNTKTLLPTRYSNVNNIQPMCFLEHLDTAQICCVQQNWCRGHPSMLILKSVSMLTSDYCGPHRINNLTLVLRSFFPFFKFGTPPLDPRRVSCWKDDLQVKLQHFQV